MTTAGAVETLRQHPGRWLWLPAVAGRAAEARGLVESRPRPKGGPGQREYRLLCAPGPYRFEERRLTLLEQMRADEGNSVPRWRVLDTRQPAGQDLDSEWFEEEHAWYECDRLNRLAAKGAVP